MLLTPEEYKKKWCPKLVGICESVSAFPNNCDCRADKCAAWRWGESKKIRIPNTFAVTNDRFIYVPNEDRRGYCGLAGLPYELREG